MIPPDPIFFGGDDFEQLQYGGSAAVVSKLCVLSPHGCPLIYCRSGEFINFFQQCYHAKRSVIMLNAILLIAGSSHQGHERFSEISRGRQCSFMSFSALLPCAQSFPVQHWDTATVDQILIEGDRMYLNALESQRIPDTDTLCLIYLPNQARSTVQSPAIEVTEQNQSPVEVTKARFHYKQDSITTHLALSYHTLFLYCYSCVLKMSLLFTNIDLTVITFSTCILK